MKNILKLDKNKKGLSEMIGYVLLIVIALSISIMVYAWIKYQLPKEKAECPEDISIILEDYDCSADGEINLTINNRGLFAVDGFYVRVRKKDDTGLPTRKVGYDMDGDGTFEYSDTGYDERTNEIFTPSQPGTEFVVSFRYIPEYTGIDMIEIQAFKIIDEDIVACENSVIKQELEGC